jgi:hypothetical protein
MGWKRRRNGRRYYYRVIRRGNRILTEYIGGGQIGEDAAKEDADRRAARASRRQNRQLRRQEHEALSDQLKEMHDEASAIAEAALLATSFYRHCRGRWRKRNVNKEEG